MDVVPTPGGFLGGRVVVHRGTKMESLDYCHYPVVGILWSFYDELDRFWGGSGGDVSNCWGCGSTPVTVGRVTSMKNELDAVTVFSFEINVASRVFWDVEGCNTVWGHNEMLDIL